MALRIVVVGSTIGSVIAAAVEPGGLSSLLPLGGASILLVYLLRVWMVEQRRWADERTAMIEEHRAELADHEADYIRHVNRLRLRISELEADNDRLRANQ